MKRFITNFFFHKHKKKEWAKVEADEVNKNLDSFSSFSRLVHFILRSCWWTGFFFRQEICWISQIEIFFCFVLNEILIFFLLLSTATNPFEKSEKHLICVSRSMRWWWWWGAEQRGDREKTGNNEKDGKVTAAASERV